MANQAEIAQTYDYIDRIVRNNLGDFADLSCAFYDGNYQLTLDQAQRAKHRYILDGIGFRKGMRVLDIGCGSGYSTALLSRFAGVVVGLEENEALADKANENLQNLDIENGAVIKGPMNLGCARQGPYQVILLGGAVEVIPQALLDQLAEGGRLVTVKIRNGVGRGHLVQKIGGILGNSDHFDANLPPLPGFQLRPEFKF